MAIPLYRTRTMEASHRNQEFSLSLTTAPPEILLQISKEVDDLQSLYHLSKAVPSIYRLWAVYGSKILQAVTSNRTVTAPQIRDLIWLVAMLRSHEMPLSWSFDVFLERFVRPTMILNMPPEPPYAPSMPVSCSFGVLALASRLQCLTHSCLEYYLERLRTVQPRLQRSTDERFDYESPYGPYDMMVPGWLRETTGVLYATPRTAPPSWIEEQVVLRAFWRSRLLQELRLAAKEFRLKGLSDTEVERLASLRLEQLFPSLHPHMLVYHEMLSVQEYQLACGASILTATGSCKNGLSKLPDEFWHNVARPGTVQRLRYVPTGLSRRGIIHLPLHGLITRDESPIKGAPFALYRRLGFALWDDQRLAALRLADVPREPGQGEGKPDSMFWFSWQSLLCEDELAEVVKALTDAESETTRQHRLDLDRYGLEYYRRNV